MPSGRGATDCTRRAIECREKPVAQVLHFEPTKAGEKLTHRAVVTFAQRAPFAVAKCSSTPRRVDNVGEHDCRQDPVDLDLAARTGEKLLDLADDATDHLRFMKRRMIVAGQLDIFGANDIVGKISPGLDGSGAVAGPMDDQCRHSDCWQNLARINLGVHFRYRNRG